VVADKDELVAELRQAKYAEVAKAHGFEVVGGSAGFTGPDRLEVNGRPMSAAAYLIATGAEPAVPSLARLGAVEPLTSATAMDHKVLPRSVVVVGRGYVGLEQAQILSDLGAEVTVVGRVAPVAEPELRDVSVQARRAVALRSAAFGAAWARIATRPRTSPYSACSTVKVPQPTMLGISAMGSPPPNASATIGRPTKPLTTSTSRP